MKALLSQYRYMPFGSDRPIAGGVTQTDFGFTGQRDLAAAGLMDYNARWYNPNIGGLLAQIASLEIGKTPKS